MIGWKNFWFTQPPRPGASDSPWTHKLVAWLDQQDRRREVLLPIVEIVIDDAGNLNTNIQCVHSLSQRVFTGQLNVHWLLAGFRHSGAGATGASGVSVGYIDGVIAKNTLELRFYAAGFTVNGANPITYYLHFWPRTERLSL